jgi:hypothetical protein
MNSASVENSSEIAMSDCGRASAMSAQTPRSGSESERNALDDRKVPPVFGRLWRECISVFALAMAPGLNVFTLRVITDDRR